MARAANATVAPAPLRPSFDFGLCDAPRPCSGNESIRRTTTTARTRYTDARTPGVIVYLAQYRHSSYGRDSLALLRRSVASLMVNYNARQLDDMLFLHTGDLNATMQHDVLALCGDTHSRFQLLDQTDRMVPPNTPPQNRWRMPAFSAGYRHMIRLYAVGIWGIVAREGYQFVMRMDEDSFIRSPIPYNLFERAQRERVDYAYRLASWESGQPPHAFFTFVRQYLEARNLTPTWLLHPCSSRRVADLSLQNCGPLYGIYNNWFLTRVSFWLRPDVQHFLQHVADSHSIYTHRWNDILWQSVAIQTFLEPSGVAMFRDFAYEHATYAMTVRTSTYATAQDVKCVWYGGLALGTSPCLEAEDRLREMLRMPFCRNHLTRHHLLRHHLRPCAVVPRANRSTTRNNDSAAAARRVGAFLVGPVVEQQGFCGRDPEPYHCTLGATARRDASARTAGDFDCACSTNVKTTRNSRFQACFKRLSEAQQVGRGHGVLKARLR